MKAKNPAKEHYQRLRVLSCEELWSQEVTSFDRANPKERMDHVAVVRAVGVVFSESGTDEQKESARRWLRQLLRDPQEKVRRYAMTALPKLGAADGEESELLTLLEKTTSDREKKHLGQTLEKIGGAATLEAMEAGHPGSAARTKQKAEANLARTSDRGAIRLEQPLHDAGDIRIHLHCRMGLEPILEEEIRALGPGGPKLLQASPGLVVVEPGKSFTLAGIHVLRCFATMSILLGVIDGAPDEVEALAQIMASPLAQRVLEAFTDGPIRYRLEFATRGHQRGLVRSVTDRVYELCPKLLNDSRSALWQIDVRQSGRRLTVEATPRLRPDPRFAYRQQDVPAASHPPLAAAMARLAGEMKDEVVWDPFCGSGQELVECARRGGVRRVVGTDLSAEAVTITAVNFSSALGGAVPSTFECRDFRDHAMMKDLKPGAVSLVISNPPMGRRVPIPNLRGLIEDFFAVATAVLEPGGRLVFANPLPVAPADRRLILEFRQKVDLGGFFVHLEKYRRA